MSIPKALSDDLASSRRLNALIIGLVIILIVLMSSSCAPDSQKGQDLAKREGTPFAESIESSPDQQTEEVMPQNIVSAEIAPLPNQANQAALALQRLGFRILHIGPTISVQAPSALWESTFQVTFREEKKTVMAETGSEVTYLRAVTDDLVIPEELSSLISEVMFVEPPEFYQGQP